MLEMDLSEYCSAAGPRLLAHSQSPETPEQLQQGWEGDVTAAICPSPDESESVGGSTSTEQHISGHSITESGLWIS